MPQDTKSRSSTGRISDAALRAARPSEKPYKIAAGGGLYLEVTPMGSKLWRWKYRLGGKENRFAIGSYPQVPLRDAIKKRDEARTLTEAGKHPSHQKRLNRISQAREHANTFEAVAREWLALHSKHWTPKTHRLRERALEQHVFQRIGALPVRQVTPAHVLDIVRGIDERAPEMAALVKRCIGAVCRLAVSTLRADIDPAAPLTGALKPRKVRHNRPLSKDELKQFVQVLDKLERHPTTKSALRLTLLTLARSCEVLGARWDEIDLESGTWIIPASRMKMREAHAVPLPSQAVEMLKKVHADTGHREHLFPNRDDPKRHVSDSILRTAVRGIGLLSFSPHGIRSTGSTMLNSMGFRADLIEKQLAHEERNRMRATYNRADYLPERREMMQLWANYLDSLAVGSEKVVPLRQNSA